MVQIILPTPSVPLIISFCKTDNLADLKINIINAKALNSDVKSNYSKISFTICTGALLPSTEKSLFSMYNGLR